MPNLQILGDEAQLPPIFNFEEAGRGQSLGNPGIQVSVSFAELPLHQLGVEAYRVFQQNLDAVSGGNRLRALKDLQFSRENRLQRIAQSVRALNQPPAMTLSLSEWRSAAEAAEFEEEY